MYDFWERKALRFDRDTLGELESLTCHNRFKQGTVVACQGRHIPVPHKCYPAVTSMTLQGPALRSHSNIGGRDLRQTCTTCVLVKQESEADQTLLIREKRPIHGKVRTLVSGSVALSLWSELVPGRAATRDSNATVLVPMFHRLLPALAVRLRAQAPPTFHAALRPADTVPASGSLASLPLQAN